MTDNIFDRLFELFQTTDAVNWRLAEEITKSLSGAPEPIDPRLSEEYEELALAAQLRLAAWGSLDVGNVGVPYPIDRAGWAGENHRSYGYLVEPLADAMGGGFTGPDAMASIMQPLGPALVGMQAGTMVGFMSNRVMGQFDTPLPALDSRRAYLVVPNIEAFAAEHDLDPRQVRLWATMHELVHVAIIGIEALRGHLSGLVRGLFAGLDFDPTRLVEKLGGLQDPAKLEGMLSESGGLAALLGGEEPPAEAGSVEAIAAFVEGYGDYAVRSAGSELLPDLTAIEEAHRIRRTEPNQATEQFGQLVGLDLQRSRAVDAAALCVEITRRWGPEALSSVWQAPEKLPHLSELTDAVGWAARTLLE
jgi:putative hydrolase